MLHGAITDVEFVGNLFGTQSIDAQLDDFDFALGELVRFFLFVVGGWLVGVFVDEGLHGFGHVGGLYVLADDFDGLVLCQLLDLGMVDFAGDEQYFRLRANRL